LNSVKASVIQEDAQRQQQMVAVNPATVARTHHLQSVIDAAHKGDFSVFESLFSALQSPFEERKDWQQWHLAPADPEHAISLSCSS
jgi:uncharacterized protein YdiU (UPF0061 family)